MWNVTIKTIRTKGGKIEERLYTFDTEKTAYAVARAIINAEQLHCSLIAEIHSPDGSLVETLT